MRGVAAPNPTVVKDAVRRGLGLSASVPVALLEVAEFSNINYVYRVQVDNRTIYVKVVPEQPKRLQVKTPPERALSEADALRWFHALAAGAVLVPELLFVDRNLMAIGMTDVGHGRDVLFKVLSTRFDLLLEQANALGIGLGRIHAGTRGKGSSRPPAEEAAIRKIIYDGLLAPGSRQVLGSLWDVIGDELQSQRECLVHADLWSKNLLVCQGKPVALVDFEGVHYGCPAFDLGTLISVALIPAFERPTMTQDVLAFVSGLLDAWASSCGSADWARQVVPQSLRASACFLASRGYGPFAYEMTDDARSRLTALARSLGGDRLPDLHGFREHVHRSLKDTRRAAASIAEGI